METNELPEDVKAKIDDEADTYSTATVWISRHPYSNSTPAGHEFNEYISEKSFNDGAEFGYRLGLQSREEQLKALMFRIDGFDRNVTQVNETNANLQRELKAKDDLLSRMAEALKEAKEHIAIYTGDEIDAECIMDKIESLLTETKPE